jgi:hypothetical protein
VSQVRKTSSSSGTYLCSMKGGACGRWTLRGMFPPRYRVSSYKGDKRGSSWLRMETAKVNDLYAKVRTDNRLNTASKGMRCNYNLTTKNVLFRNLILLCLKKG